MQAFYIYVMPALIARRMCDDSAQLAGSPQVRACKASEERTVYVVLDIWSMHQSATYKMLRRMETRVVHGSSVAAKNVQLWDNLLRLALLGWACDARAKPSVASSIASYWTQCSCRWLHANDWSVGNVAEHRARLCAFLTSWSACCRPRSAARLRQQLYIHRPGTASGQPWLQMGGG